MPADEKPGTTQRRGDRRKRSARGRVPPKPAAELALAPSGAQGVARNPVPERVHYGRDGMFWLQVPSYVVQT